MTANPRVSVVIPLYREFRWLREAVESVTHCGFDDWEALLVNDGSPADPRPHLREALEDRRFHYLERPHGGISAVRNAGAESARGEWLAFLDQDDRVLPGRFSRQLGAAGSGNEGAAVIYSDYERVDEAGTVIDRYVSRSVPPHRLPRECLGDHGPVALGTALIRREWFRRVQGFDPDIPGFDECDLFLRLSQAGGRFVYAPGVVHAWRDHPENTMKSEDFQRSRLAFVDKVRRMARADDLLRRVLPRFESRSWHAVGLHYAQRGRWEEAMRWSRKAWLRDPFRGSALYLALKAWFLYRRGRAR